MNIKYYAVEEINPDHKYEFTPDHDDWSRQGQSYAAWSRRAKACAEDYFYHHRGHEVSWPLTFHLYGFSEQQVPEATVVVDLVVKPSFSPLRIRK